MYLSRIPRMCPYVRRYPKDKIMSCRTSYYSKRHLFLGREFRNDELATLLLVRHVALNSDSAYSFAVPYLLISCIRPIIAFNNFS